MPERKKIWKWTALILGGILLVFLAVFVYVLIVSTTKPPEVSDRSALEWQRKEPFPGLFTVQNDWFRKSNTGLFELYVEGKPFERGVAEGKLTAELIRQQEDYFNEQITRMVPSKFYLHFLKYVIGWFNRDLDKYVPEEYKEEIYGVSFAASDRYRYIGSNYQRILNYHSAHDIGHALQNLALVGCTSFGTWGKRSANGELIIGRNFDFYAGDKFAENKIISFEHPSEGYRFMSVGWGGFIGVVSGMNEKGLTVTINAATSEVPSGSATPVSIVAREILQYAKNISEAWTIARKRKMFVSESFLIGSAEDRKAVIIEKTPDSIGLYDPGGQEILCANHFQSPELGNLRSNRIQLRQSASVYRYQRLQELLGSVKANTVTETAKILRDRSGLEGADIGMGNEKALNQLIAHHSVIFEPEHRKVWVSAGPWQLGVYVCYNLDSVFSPGAMRINREIASHAEDIPADSFMKESAYLSFLKFREYKKAVSEGVRVDPDSLISSNPHFYQAYQLAGNEMYAAGDFKKAIDYYRQALSHEVATKTEENEIRNRISQAEEKLKKPS